MDYCTLNADCDDANTECREEGANTGMLRCQCLDGYVLVASEDDGVYYCGESWRVWKIQAISSPLNTCQSAELIHLIFHPLEVVSRYRGTQLQVVKITHSWFNLRSDIYKYWA